MLVCNLSIKNKGVEKHEVLQLLPEIIYTYVYVSILSSPSKEASRSCSIREIDLPLFSSLFRMGQDLNGNSSAGSSVHENN